MKLSLITVSVTVKHILEATEIYLIAAKAKSVELHSIMPLKFIKRFFYYSTIIIVVNVSG